MLLDVRTIYAEPAALQLERGRQVVERWPGAEVIEVASANRIDAVHGDEQNVQRWVRVKTEVLALGVRKTMTARVNGRSADWIAPSAANGCAMACAYCYVPRHKGYANPVTVYANIEQMIGYLTRHVARQGPKTEPNQCDPSAWVYDLGENSDCSVDAMISDNVADLVAAFRDLPTAKASFATKQVNRDLLAYDPRQRTRIRFSVMPARTAKLLDIRTSSVAERIAAVDDFLAAGYEVHLNLSPVVVHEEWLTDWAELLEQLNDVLSPAAKAQAAAEVIFLTHNEGLHDLNLGWHPQAEDLLWRPDIQEFKISQNRMRNVRYRAAWKSVWKQRLLDLIGERAPWLTVRYAF
ncbi:spore photoproduct lyase family protein [Kineosporia sp. J2-2]|uniref:Spore photoproduct lyase family protein n=1 Tax=Kineosporia corallincola TaxID=2835133 RepID=A0ABS5TK72_9ACTN|nr:spore photoproduct lyase family protein [Kineosporia corallincola]MBT0771233.1 spore photoproduct lyase family protein [Kineosporia corallincola]